MRIIWQRVRRITDDISGVKGLNGRGHLNEFNVGSGEGRWAVAQILILVRKFSPYLSPEINVKSIIERLFVH